MSMTLLKISSTQPSPTKLLFRLPGAPQETPLHQSPNPNAETPSWPSCTVAQTQLTASIIEFFLIPEGFHVSLTIAYHCFLSRSQCMPQVFHPSSFHRVFHHHQFILLHASRRSCPTLLLHTRILPSSGSGWSRQSHPVHKTPRVVVETFPSWTFLPNLVQLCAAARSPFLIRTEFSVPSILPHRGEATCIAGLQQRVLEADAKT